MQRCYCGSMSSAAMQHQPNCLPLLQQQHLRQTYPRGDLMSVASSSRQSLRPTQFLKRPSLKSAPTYGLGHSNTGLGNDFSRRNSAATTVSHCSSCSSAQHRQQSRAKVLRWGWEKTGGVDTSNKSFITGSTNNKNYDKYTENRRIYEQSACVASRQMMSQGQGQVRTSNSASSPRPGPSPRNKHSTDELQQLRALQQFRLSNVSDCFSDGHQDELRLQQAYDKLSGHKMNKWNKNRANESRQQEMNDTTTPYALRQKLLQLRLQEEQRTGRGTGGVCAPLEKSCALRYN